LQSVRSGTAQGGGGRERWDEVMVLMIVCLFVVCLCVSLID
jgi:hypothetical protein